MFNYKLLIKYNGTAYNGWQRQNNQITIQGVLEDCIKTLIRSKVTLNGSGRTDTGVHALGQVANFKTETEIDLYRFTFSLNCILPKDIVVDKAELIDENFHARHDAKRRVYNYFILNKRDPFWEDFAFRVHQRYNLNQLNTLSKQLIGIFDFSSFMKHNYELENKICTIHDCRWRQSGNLLIFRIEANRFLHGMVRSIVGTILNCCEKNIESDHIPDIIKLKDRKAASFSVPAKGLFLRKVIY